jgi:hypothetical protein
MPHLHTPPSTELKQHRRDLLPNRPRGHLRLLRLLRRRYPRDKVHLPHAPKPRPLRDLVPKEQGEEDRYVDVRHQERGCGEVVEDGVAVDEDEEDGPEHAPVGEVRLEAVVVQVRGGVEALREEALACD